jgi:hypothetical protein
MESFWLFIAILIGVVFLLTWLGAVFTRNAPSEAERARREDGAMLPDAERDDTLF